MRAMPRYMVTATEKSATLAGAPSSAAILTVLNDAARAGGDWVGPAPRVTKTLHTPSPTQGYWTTFAWPIDVHEGLLEDRLRAVREGVAYALSRIGTWYNLSITPYSESLNGPTDFWTSGNAARTRTRDDFPSGTARLDPDENPIGPNDPETRLPTALDRLGGAADKAVDTIQAVTTLLVVGAVVYAGFLIIPALTKPRNNPVRRRRRSNR